MDNLTSRSVTSTSPSSPGDNINVVVRVRPLQSNEKKRKEEMVIQLPGNGQIYVRNPFNESLIYRNNYFHHFLFQCDGSSANQKPKLFSYNVVFEPGATQDDVLQYSGIKRLLEMATEGFSCTAFCYGQTTSGKTHTLTGPPELVRSYIFITC